MDDPTTPAPTSGEPTAANQDNWESRYVGLQRATAKQAERLTATTAELDRLSAEHESAMAELESYRQRDAEANAEEAARAQYEQLKARFEPPNAKPVGSNPALSWADRRAEKVVEKSADGFGAGFPV